jgi:hypothetical protein
VVGQHPKGIAVKNIREIVDTATQRARSGIFSRVCRELTMAKGDITQALRHAEGSNVLPDVLTVLRSAAAAGTTSDSAWAGPLYQYSASATAFLDSLRYRSVFDTVRLGGAMQLPPLVSAVSVASGVSGGDASETGLIAAAKLTLSSNKPVMRYAAAIIAMSEQVVRYGTGDSSDLFNTELQRGVAAAVDSVWLSALNASVSPTGSAGSTTANKQTDLAALIGALTFGPNDAIIIVHGPGNMAKLALSPTTTGAAAFEGLGVQGGQYAGITFMPSDQLPSGAALGIVANGWIVASEPPLIDASREASLQLDTSPDSPATGSTDLVSL